MILLPLDYLWNEITVQSSMWVDLMGFIPILQRKDLFMEALLQIGRQ